MPDSEQNYKLMENHSNRVEIQDAFKGELGESFRFSETVKENMMYIAMPVKSGNEIVAVYRISVFLKNIDDIIKSFKIEIFILALIFLIITAILSYIVSRKFSYPIQVLTNASKRVANNDFSATVFFDKANYEIKLLADNFSDMTVKLKNSFIELNNEKEELDSIISSMKEGILVLDNSGKIIRTNKNFLILVNKDKVIGKYYWEILRDSSITNFIKNYNLIKKNIVSEINYNEKTLLCSMNYLLTKNGFVFIFYDISEMKSLENIKKEFTINVSHELRTPLTAIKGFTETLFDEEKSDDKKRYLEIILRNTERLINIVNDLLILSNIEEEKNSSLEISEVNIDNAVKNIFNIFENKVKEKDLKLIYKNISKTKIIETDLNKIEQIFINLIDNAVKYTDSGEVKLSISETDGSVNFEIADTGIGIPENDIARIFERFYVVDKSRSKKNGGTGLGLAIVKHDVILLNGDITVSSEIGKGTTFTIIIPKKFAILTQY